MKKYKIERKEYVFYADTRELVYQSKWAHHRNYKTFESARDALRDFRNAAHFKVNRTPLKDIIVFWRHRIVYNTGYIKELIKKSIKEEVESIFTIKEAGFAPMDDIGIENLTDKIYKEIYG